MTIEITNLIDYFRWQCDKEHQMNVVEHECRRRSQLVKGHFFSDKVNTFEISTFSIRNPTYFLHDFL